MVTSASEQDRIIKEQIYPLSEGKKKKKAEKADKAFWNVSGGPAATNLCSQCRKSDSILVRELGPVCGD